MDMFSSFFYRNKTEQTKTVSLYDVRAQKEGNQAAAGSVEEYVEATESEPELFQPRSTGDDSVEVFKNTLQGISTTTEEPEIGDSDVNVALEIESSKGEVRGKVPTTKPVTLSGMSHLLPLVRDYDIHSLDSIAKSCGLRVVTGLGTIDLISTLNSAVICTVQEDSFDSGHYLLAASLAKFIIDRGVAPFKIDLNLNTRIQAIEQRGVFDNVEKGASYETYLRLLNAEPSYEEPVQIDLTDFRDEVTGVWDLQEFISTVQDKRNDATVVVVMDVDACDIPLLRQLEGYTVYFQAPKTYTANGWKQQFGYVKTASRKRFPESCELYKTAWVVIGSEERGSSVAPMAPGPECSMSVRAIEAKLEEALRLDLWVVPERMGIPIRARPAVTTVTNQEPLTIKVTRESALKALPDHLKPTRGHYELLAEAVKLGQSGGLALIKTKGITETNSAIFGGCLNSNGLPMSFKRRLTAINKAEYSFVTRFHQYIKVLSEPGMIQETGRVPPQPIEVAIWQMVRAYSQAGCHPSMKLDYEWCLEI